MSEARQLDLSRVAEVVGIVAVVASLLMVAWELRQNTEATIGETSQGLLTMLVEIDAWLLEPEFAAIAARVDAGERLEDPAEALQYATWIYGKFNLCENVFDRRAAGLIGEDYWLAWEGGCEALLEAPHARQVWAERREWYGPSFRAHFDEKLAAFADEG